MIGTLSEGAAAAAVGSRAKAAVTVVVGSAPSTRLPVRVNWLPLVRFTWPQPWSRLTPCAVLSAPKLPPWYCTLLKFRTFPEPLPASRCASPERLAEVRFVRLAVLPPPPMFTAPVIVPAVKFKVLAKAPMFTTPMIVPVLVSIVGAEPDTMAKSVDAPEVLLTKPALLRITD